MFYNARWYDSYANKVWFTVGRPETLGVINQDMDLRSVDLQTGEIVNYGHAKGMLDDEKSPKYMKYSYRPIAVDKLGNIWLGYFARLKSGQDKKYTWETLPYSPEFIVTDDPDFAYLWASVYSIYTSPDGNLWFNTSAGLIQHDTNQDKWCINTFSRGLKALTDDDKGNIWLSIGEGRIGHLYKYSVNP